MDSIDEAGLLTKSTRLLTNGIGGVASIGLGAADEGWYGAAKGTAGFTTGYFATELVISFGEAATVGAVTLPAFVTMTTIAIGVGYFVGDVAEINFTSAVWTLIQRTRMRRHSIQRLRHDPLSIASG